MIDKKKVEGAIKLMNESGAKAYMVLAYDDNNHGVHVKGTIRDLAMLIANVLVDDDMDKLFALGVQIHLAKGRRNENAD